MAVVETGACDGCGRQVSVEMLHAVTMPDGEAVACCPDCRLHAEEIAGGATSTCEGCGDDVPAVDLERIDLPDGRSIECCLDCRIEAERVGVEGATGGQSGGSTNADAAPESDGTDTAAAADASTSEETDIDRADGSNRIGSTGKPATTRSVCDQCGESFSVELYRVETVDGRTEAFCPDCKDAAVEEGVVRDVKLRRAQAYEALDVDGDADADEIRDAYLQRVKETHPDRAAGCRSEFMLVKRAYDRLAEE